MLSCSLSKNVCTKSNIRANILFIISVNILLNKNSLCTKRKSYYHKNELNFVFKFARVSLCVDIMGSLLTIQFSKKLVFCYVYKAFLISFLHVFWKCDVVKHFYYLCANHTITTTNL